MPVRKTVKRQNSFRIRLSDRMTADLHDVADVLGVPSSTLCALAIGQYVATQKRQLQVITGMADAIGGEIGKAMQAEFGEQLSLMKGAKA